MRAACLAWFFAPALLTAAHAAVRVTVGATPIQDGEAKAAGDITIVNEKLAFALAVGSPAPYGVPRGAIIDVAPVVNGKIGRDCVVFADFIPDNWSAWPNTFQRIEILERGPARVVVRTVRDWGRVTLTTLYTLRTNSDSVEIRATMSNLGAGLPGLLSGFTLWPKRGYLFEVPGLAGVARGTTDEALSDRVVAYDEDWTVALHAPYADRIADGSMDMYRSHSLQSGESRTFDAWLQVGATGDLKPIVAAEISRRRLQSGIVRGAVSAADGTPVDSPVVVIEEHGKPYAWVLGRKGEYEVALPVGDYGLYATARNHSQSETIRMRVAAGAVARADFRGLQLPGSIRWSVTDAATGKPLDARVSIAQGQKPLVGYLGRKTFFTELDRKGRVDVTIAPGHYVFTVSAGGGFVSERRQVELSVAPGEQRRSDIAVTRLFDPPASHWFSADLHHHADQAEGVTPPQELARSQLAAGLDLLFVSDHDSTVNHSVLQAIADRRGMGFIPAIELSASWGHFNAYPLRAGEKLNVDTGTATIDDILGEGRRLGATVIQVNHPFIPYGYFTSVSAGVAPGGFNPAFDLIEINAGEPGDDAKVLQTLWDFWNAGHRYYLGAGTDTHDVWRSESGAVRTFAHIDGAATAQTFSQALKDGHGYVTSGPLVFPSVMFGDQLKVKPAEAFSLEFDLKAVSGIKKAELIGSGKVVQTKSFDPPPPEVHLAFALRTERPAWYSLTVEDGHGRKAYTDPVWVVPVDAPFVAAPASGP